MRELLTLSFATIWSVVCAQPDPIPPRLNQRCVFSPPDSVDITSDGIADLVIHGVHGIATCDIPVSIGSCWIHVSTLPGTMLLALVQPMGGRDVHGFAKGDTIPALTTGVQDDLRIPRYAFMDGSVRALHWTYGRNGVSPPVPAPMADRTFVFATTMDARTVVGTFTLDQLLSASTVRIRVGTSLNLDGPHIVP